MFALNVSYIVYFLFAVDFWDAFGTGLQQGDQCIFMDGTIGTCKFLTSCPPALESLQVGIFPQNVCGFQGTKSIFCCRETGPVTNPTPAPTKPTPVLIKITAATPHHTNKPKLPSRAPGEISKQMCKKYMKFVPDSYKCPFSADMTVGSSFASRQEFPHMAIIIGKGNPDPVWLCGGSLISEEFVLAPAACFYKTSNSGHPVLARIGVSNLSDIDHAQDIKIKEVIVHPSIYNDIALVRLEKKVYINNYARPACLFTEREIGTEKAINSGWGPTKLRGEIDDKLQKATLEIYTEEKCNKAYPSFISVRNISTSITYDTMVCAGTKANATPQPQMGGPLLILHKEDGIGNKCISDIIGVASFGKGGFVKDVPDVYTRVSAFIPWIEENVWN